MVNSYSWAKLGDSGLRGIITPPRFIGKDRVRNFLPGPRELPILSTACTSLLVYPPLVSYTAKVLGSPDRNELPTNRGSRHAQIYSLSQTWIPPAVATEMVTRLAGWMASSALYVSGTAPVRASRGSRFLSLHYVRLSQFSNYHGVGEVFSQVLSRIGLFRSNKCRWYAE